jgi:hypothetical protein
MAICPRPRDRRALRACGVWAVERIGAAGSPALPPLSRQCIKQRPLEPSSPHRHWRRSRSCLLLRHPLHRGQRPWSGTRARDRVAPAALATRCRHHRLRRAFGIARHAKKTPQRGARGQATTPWPTPTPNPEIERRRCGRWRRTCRSRCSHLASTRGSCRACAR